jgi:hypothetical protein
LGDSIVRNGCAKARSTDVCYKIRTGARALDVKREEIRKEGKLFYSSSSRKPNTLDEDF